MIRRLIHPARTCTQVGFLVSLLVGLSVGLLWNPSGAAAGGPLRNFINDLFPGGIRLQPGIGHDPHFSASSLEQLAVLDQSIGSSVNQPSPTSGVAQFTFDVERGMPVESEDSLGPLTGQRATTLGAHKLTLGVTFTRTEFKRFEGRRLDDLRVRFIHEDANQDGCIGCPPNTFELDTIPTRIKVQLIQEIVAIQANYGLTDRWDAGFVLPIVTIRAHAKAESVIDRRSGGFISGISHNFGSRSSPPSPDRDRAIARSGGERTGVGDLLLRTKYTLLRAAPETAAVPDLAGFLQVKFPTGDPDNLLGTGETDVLAMLAVSRRFGRVTPYVNLGYEFSTAGRSSDNLRYLVGLDARVTRHLTVAAEVVGRSELAGDGVGDHLVDFALGGKLNVYRSLILNFAVQTPITRNIGLRPDLTWTVGLEYAF